MALSLHCKYQTSLILLIRAIAVGQPDNYPLRSSTIIIIFFWIISTTPMELQLLTQVHPNFFPCRSHLARVIRIMRTETAICQQLPNPSTTCSGAFQRD